jgi:hypothetical protein
MEEFVLAIRQIDISYTQVSEAELEAIMVKWENWFGGIAAQGKLKSTGIRLSAKGQVLKPGGVIVDGPFVEIRERLGGFIVVLADTIDEATTLAHGCPALDFGGSVEIRPFHEVQRKLFI